MKFSEEKGSRSSRGMQMVSESLRREDKLSQFALDSYWLDSFGRTFLRHSSWDLCTPPMIFDDCNRFHYSCIKMPPNGILSYWVLKLHLFFWRNNFGEPHRLSIWEGELDPNQKETNGFIPFFSILFLQKSQETELNLQYLNSRNKV